MIAFDFIKKSKAFNQNKTKKKQLFFTIRKADKQVAHLTYARNRYNHKTKPWPFVDIGRKMHKTISAFHNNLPDSYKKWRYILKLKEIIDYNSTL